VELEAFVDGLVRDAMQADHIAGVTVSIVQNGQIVLSKGYGFADFAPVRRVDPNQTLFRLGSVSKTFTWIALMQQVEAGRVRLDAPINTYLPDELDVPRGGQDREIRVRDLMTHTPGFDDPALGHLFVNDADRIRPLGEYLRRERPRRVREPGELPTYSNYGVGLAGAALAQLTGRPFEDLVEARITGPLGMRRTSFREPYPAREGLPAPLSPALASQISEGFFWSGGRFEERPFEHIHQIAPAGAASSTATDMARYMLAVLNGGALEGQAIYGPATANAFRSVLQRSAPGVSGWAHGFMEYPLPGGFRGYGHGGATLSFFTNMVTVPDLGLGVFISTNTSTGRPLVERAPAMIVQNFYGPPQPAPRAGSPALRADADAYEGPYFTTRRVYSGLEKFVSMFQGVVRVVVTPEGRLMIAGGGDAESFVPEGEEPGRFISVDGEERLVFAMEDGRATRFYATWGGAAYDRLPWLQKPGLLAWVAALTLTAVVFTLVGAGFRVVRGARQSPSQRRSSIAEIVTSIIWVVAFAAFILWALNAGDVANILYGWPGPLLLLASTSALIGALCSLFLLLLLFPSLRADWRGGWTLFRRLRHTTTVLIFCGFSGLLLFWGALAPWSA
jgi:CubicO group peptidase (beta-lactamase class C family)